MKVIKILILELTLFLIILSNSITAQNKIITSFEYQSHKIIIYYEFKGDSSASFDVSVVLKRKSEPSYSLIPKLTQGDIGEGIFANERREIIWNLSQQEEDNLTADDYYFEVTANEIKKSSGIAWYVYVGGALIGGAAAILLAGKKNEANTTTSAFTFPSPPPRPTGTFNK